jgi:hypothetical protein
MQDDEHRSRRVQGMFEECASIFFEEINHHAGTWRETMNT